jgi:hypothetical protein
VGRETWGTYSVRDHLVQRAFVADVMLYDRLVLPVPPLEPDEEHQREWKRWEGEGWEPHRQTELLGLLGPIAYPVPWGSTMRTEWERKWIAAQIAGESTTPYQVTGGVLAAGLPANVTAVTAVATYPSKEAFERSVGLRPTEPGETKLYPGNVVCAALGREFLIPDPDEHRSDNDLLRATVDLACDSEFRQKRRNFWRWEREFITDGVTDQAAIDAAVSEMGELIEEEKSTVRKSKLRTVSRYAFTVATITLGLVGGPLTPLAIGGAFVSVARFTADRLLEGQPVASQSPAALFHDTRRQLGWD